MCQSLVFSSKGDICVISIAFFAAYVEHISAISSTKLIITLRRCGANSTLSDVSLVNLRTSLRENDIFTVLKFI